MSDLTRDDVIDMLQGIFEEQRELTDEEMQEQEQNDIEKSLKKRIVTGQFSRRRRG